MMNKIISTLLIILKICKSVQIQYLNDGWILNVLSCNNPTGNALVGKKINTSIPTSFHLDLLHSNIILDPFYRSNYLSIKWVSECKVRYTTFFQIKQQNIQNHNIRIVFEGIDTYSVIKLNGNQILKTSNAFIRYFSQISKYINQGENILEVQISPTVQTDQQGQRTNPMPSKYAHTRKPCYQYSWDWAPYLNSVGIWKNVSLQIYQNVKLDYVWIRNKLIDSEKAVLNFVIVISVVNQEIFKTKKYKAKIFSEKFGQKLVSITSKNTYEQIVIQNPKLWWPNGIGQPYLYPFIIQIISQQVIIDQKTINYGIRTVQLNLENLNFQIIINGYPVYCKGANYVPPDMFYTRLQNNQTTYPIKQIIKDAIDSNFNMIRLWGGGQYESDEFYQECSKNGLMVFHDFMFSDSIYPSTKQFLINVEQEIKQQVRRIRNYPCLTLWSGNNQVLQGIKVWGWSKLNYKQDYQRLFETLLKKIIQYQNPQIPYIPSSPIYGVGNSGFQRGGDIHYWGVWAAGYPFQEYNHAIGPFNSQFGTQSFPVWETILQFTRPQDRNYNSPILLAHERHNSKFSTLKKYIDLYGKKSINFQMEVYQSGLIQAFGIEVAIKAQRASKPKSWGTLYWQFNDAWPAISWSSIDYYGRWKPLQYMAKRLYPDVAIVFYQNQVKVINDKLYPVQVKCLIQLISFDGEILLKQIKEMELKQNQVTSIFILNQMLIKGKESNTLLLTKIQTIDGSLMESTHFFQNFQKQTLPQSFLSVEYYLQQNSFVVNSAKLIKNLYISNSKQYIKLTDNYFDLIPNHPRRIKIISDRKLEEFIDNMVYMSYRQVFTNDSLTVNKNIIS